jgi:hypothetical protein
VPHARSISTLVEENTDFRLGHSKGLLYMQSPTTKASSNLNLRQPNLAILEPVSSSAPLSTFSAWPEESEAHDLGAIESLIETAKTNLSLRNHKIAAQLLERVLPALDEFYMDNLPGKVQVLRLLRDCYLALSRGVEAQDCAELALSIYEEMMTKHRTKIHALTVIEPSAFTRPVIRKLRSLRRARESEYLRKRSADVTERWQTLAKH